MERLAAGRTALMKRLKSKKVYRAVLLVLLVAVPALFLTDYFALGILLVAPVVMAWLVKYAEIRWSGVELATFSTVMLGMAFGPRLGAILGLFVVTTQMIVGQWIGPYILWVIPSYAVAGAVAGLLSTTNPVTLGIGITIGIHAIFLVFTAFMTPGGLPKYTPYAIGNIIFNIILFQAVGAPVAGILG